MRLRTYYRRSLLYHWRANIAVALGAAVATSVLTGALIVGDSMRASLRAVALGRLGPVDYALVSHRFFTRELAVRLATDPEFGDRFGNLSPLILSPGGCVHAERRTRAEQVNIFGVDSTFWNLGGSPGGVESPDPRSVIVNELLAAELGAQPGDDLLLRLGKPSAVSTETLLGRRDDTVTTLRLTVASIVPAEGLGGFSLKPHQASPRNAFVPLEALQRALSQIGRVNAIVVSGGSTRDTASEGDARMLQQIIRGHMTLADLGLSLRVDEVHDYVALESDGILLEPAIEEATVAAASAAGLMASPILTHLANTIAHESPPGRDLQLQEDAAAPPITEGNRTSEPPRAASQTGKARVIPYSTIAAVDPGGPTAAALAQCVCEGESELAAGGILLNEWAADDLGARVGDRITITYYVTGDFGRLDTRSSSFVLRGVLALRGAAADPGFIPEYRGVTDTENLADWDPPFPIDLSAVRDEDEAYWDTYRTTPKAFIALSDGQRLWSEDAERFGRLTSIRLTPSPSLSGPGGSAGTAEVFRQTLLEQVDPARLGLSFDAVRQQAVEAGEGSTDFGMLFIGFSFFLIASAAMLVALLFRLGIERRSSEVGLLLATGFAPQTATRLLIAEGTALATLGGVIGLVGAAGYAWMMLVGLRSWWSEAVNAPFLRLFLSPSSMGVGFLIGVVIASASTAWSMRGLTRRPTRALLAGVVDESLAQPGRRRRRRAMMIAGGSFTIVLALMATTLASSAMPLVLAFFGGGTATLVACLALFAHWLGGRPKGAIHQTGVMALTKLAVRNAPRHGGRSMLTAGLIASATFLIVALEAFRLDPGASTASRDSGSGGFALYAESAVPLGYDLNTSDGREALNVRDPVLAPARGVFVMPFRLRPGDQSSCLNLYRPTKPRILGVTAEMIRRGGFRFASSTASTKEENENPWALLDKSLPDGAIAAIGDESAVMWQLHLGLGKDLIITDEQGRNVPLRFVALLKGSALQDELLIAESQFVRLFPSITGHSFFLIEASSGGSGDVERALERELDAFGLDSAKTEQRLSSYLAVQNTYLSTFQALGGLGLLLGTTGMAVVLLRNIWERRKELALLRALGFSKMAVGAVVLLENLALLFVGLAAGIASALLAVAPSIYSDPASIPWLSLAGTLALVLAAGVAVGVAATTSSLSQPLLGSLRAE